MGSLFTINTAIGNAVPFLKTPMNVIEEHENKVTGLLIGLPMVLTRLFPDLDIPSSLDSAGAINGGHFPVAMSNPVAAGLIAIPAVIACYSVVWLTFHSMHVIALVSPFGIIDTGLKFGRLGLLGMIALLSFISPLLGMLICTVIILISYFIAGWSFRLLIFGSLLSWDLLLFRHRRQNPSDDVIARGFLCRTIENAPVRSYGRLSRNHNGKLLFHYRPWLMAPEQRLELSTENLSIQRGIVSPIAQERSSGSDEPRNLVRFRPKFRGHEDTLAQHLEASGIEDHVIRRGLRQAAAWLQEVCRPAVATN